MCLDTEVERFVNILNGTHKRVVQRVSLVDISFLQKHLLFKIKPIHLREVIFPLREVGLDILVSRSFCLHF